ncbi:PEGA domain-containing protein [bacterium]|nr:PEGA domain-containing protein [bacterium]
MSHTMTRPRRLLTTVVPAALSLVLIAAGRADAATVHLTGPAGAEVSIDGQHLGSLPLAPLDLPVGTHVVRCRAHAHEDLTQDLVVADPTAIQHVRLRPLPLRRSRAVTGSLMYAGLGQWYAGADLRGWAYFLGESVGLITALGGELARSNEQDEYTNAIRNYEQAVAAPDVTFWRNEAATAYQNARDMADLRDLGLMIAGGAWALSILDAWLLTPTVDVGAGPVPPSAMRADMPAPLDGVHAAVTIEF